MICITDFILTGRENAISLADLSHVTELPERAVRKEILQARLEGNLIISSDEGYFMPSDEDDIREYAIRRKAYIVTANKALNPFLKALKGR